MACNCIEQTNEALKADNLELVTHFLYPSFKSAIMLTTRPIVKKRGQKASSIHCNYCPLCGVKREEDKSGKSVKK